MSPAYLVIPLALLFASCGSSSEDASTATSAPGDVASTEVSTDVDSVDVTTTEATDADGTTLTPSTGAGLDVGLFFDGALADEVTTEDCTLSGGAETTCYRITVAGYPASHDIGPFCPDTITDTADNGGIWFDGNGTYDLDGQFFVDLPTLYGDDAWQMYDEDGNILVTETAEGVRSCGATRCRSCPRRTTASKADSSGSTTVSRSRPRC